MSNNNEQQPKTMYKILMSAVTKDFVPTDEEMKSINSMMLAKNLIGDPLGAITAKYIDDNYKTLPINVQYWLVRSVFHDKNRIKTVAIPSKVNPSIQIIRAHYKVSHDVAHQYLALLSEEDIQALHELYKEGKVTD